jgi:recombinational DNA repair ATPase RecF
MNRMLALLWKWVQVQLLHAGDRPILLLIDDAFAEVDDANKSWMMGELQKLASIVYATILAQDAQYLSDVQVLHVDHGRLSLAG